MGTIHILRLPITSPRPALACKCRGACATVPAIQHTWLRHARKTPPPLPHQCCPFEVVLLGLSNPQPSPWFETSTAGSCHVRPECSCVRINAERSSTHVKLVTDSSHINQFLPCCIDCNSTPRRHPQAARALTARVCPTGTPSCRCSDRC